MRISRWVEASGGLWSLCEDDPLVPGCDRTVCRVEVEAGKIPVVSAMARALSPAETAALARILRGVYALCDGCVSGPKSCPECERHGGCPVAAAQRLMPPTAEAEGVPGIGVAERCRACRRYFDEPECPYCAELRRRREGRSR